MRRLGPHSKLAASRSTNDDAGGDADAKSGPDIILVDPGVDQLPMEDPFTASPEEAQSVSGTTIWRLVDGKISEAWIILDR